MEGETPLTGGRTTTGVVKIGDTVRRPINGRGSFAHELLLHFERRGFNGVPRFQGIDDAGREILTFIPGFVPPELGHFTDEQLAYAARLLRQFHDATLDFPLRHGQDVICHGDASPCNCVFVDGTPRAFIDVDAAHPGSRLDDLGYAAWLWIDIGNDELSPDFQGQRLADFYRSYGMDFANTLRSVVAAQIALAQRASLPGVREWSRNCRSWVERHHDELSSSITRRSKTDAG
jgi:Ser/Thr protein kinase RdoA (MazF antagonist)